MLAWTFAWLERALARFFVICTKATLAAFGLAIDHHVVEQVVVPAHFPDLRVHDDRAIEPGHFEGCWGTFVDGQLVVPADHIVPPGIFDVSL